MIKQANKALNNANPFVLLIFCFCTVFMFMYLTAQFIVKTGLCLNAKIEYKRGNEKYTIQDVKEACK